MPGFPHASWAVEGELLHALPGGEALSLISREAFGDFELTLEWRLPAGGNSGLLYRVSEEAEAPWQSGPEMQLLDDARHPDGRVPETRCGALYGLYAPEVDPGCLADGFNAMTLRVHRNRVEHWLNGVCVLRCDIASPDFRNRVARSKFRDFPNFARAAQGHIVLQHHGDEAWFRNVRVE
jgi:Domain of Unknown Function (DUF1080)